ncbi:MAG: hypothetical protein GC191_20770 [Azospirillum sp.]|nr:hypothetical protein [Azospirillum sp.]
MSSVIRLAAWAGGLTIALAALLYPAILNGFPITYFDTGGYIVSAFRPEVWPGRAAAYGFLIKYLHAPGTLYPLIVFQALLVAWFLNMVARSHNLPHGPLALAVTSVVLAAATAVSWFSAQAMPDIFQPLLVLGLFLIVFRRDHLGSWERLGVVLVIWFAVAAHMVNVGLAIGLVILCVVAGLLCWVTRWSRKLYVIGPAIFVALGVATIPLLNQAIDGKFRFVPGGDAFVFGRLVQDGIVDRFLSDNCPSPEYQLCAYQGRMPKTADDWLWGADSPFNQLGQWDGMSAEMQAITLASLEAYPRQHFDTAVAATWSQLKSVATGDGVIGWHWLTKWAVESFTPDLLPDYLASRQSRGDLSFAELNRWQVPIALAATALCAWLVLILAGFRQLDLAWFCTFVSVAILGNAMICGIFANAHDRYGSRIVWLAVLAVLLTGQRILQSMFGRRPVPAEVPERAAPAPRRRLRPLKPAARPQRIDPVIEPVPVAPAVAASALVEPQPASADLESAPAVPPEPAAEPVSAEPVSAEPANPEPGGPAAAGFEPAPPGPPASPEPTEPVPAPGTTEPVPAPGATEPVPAPGATEPVPEADPDQTRSEPPVAPKPAPPRDEFAVVFPSDEETMPGFNFRPKPTP